MNIGDPSRTATSAAQSVKQQTHLEQLLEAAQNNEKRTAQAASFLCDILSKIRGTSVPVDGQPGPDRIGGTLGCLEDSLCNTADSLHIIEIALQELNGTV